MKRPRDRILALLATSGGLGYCPGMPGTAGTLPGVGIFLAIALLSPPALHAPLIAAALVAVSAVTVAITPWAERHWKKTDPGNLVTDEVAGFLATVLMFWPFHDADLWLTTCWAFGVTRVMDIFKPPPVRQLERLPAGWGVLIDDLGASVYAAILLHAAAAVWPRLFGA